MAIPSTGAISLQTIQTEYGGPASPIPISSYYAGGANVPAGTTGNLGVIPSSGTINFDHFRGSQKVLNTTTWQYVGHHYTTQQNGSWSVAANIGAAAANRSIIVVVTTTENVSCPAQPVSMTLGGVAMTVPISTGNPNQQAYAFHGYTPAFFPTGTTANFVLNMQNNCGYRNFSLYVYRSTSPTPMVHHDIFQTSTLSNPVVGTIALPAGGVGVTGVVANSNRTVTHDSPWATNSSGTRTGIYRSHTSGWTPNIATAASSQVVFRANAENILRATAITYRPVQ